MISRRAPRDGDRSRTVVLPDSCRTIGAQLAAARETRQLSVEALASTLLLSKGQILGLEQADPSPFYNTAFFLRGLRKYMSHVGVPAHLLIDDADTDDHGELRLMLADIGPAPARATGHSSRAWVWPGVVAAVVVLTAASALYVSRLGWAVATPLPAQPIQVRAETPFRVRAEPAAMTMSADDPDSMVRVSVGKATWVFIRYPDNRVVERRLAAGEAFEVGPLPAYLAVGTAESVELRVENRPVALGPYIHNGQVRLTRPDLARLVP